MEGYVVQIGWRSTILRTLGKVKLVYLLVPLLTFVAATLSTGVGVAVALHLSRLSPRWRTLLSFVIALPLTFSGLIVAYGFILGYGRAGFVTQLLSGLGLDAATIGGARRALRSAMTS